MFHSNQSNNCFITFIIRKKMKPRQFFLFNDIIVFANIILPRKSYFKQRIIKLVEITIELSQSEKGNDFLFCK